MNNYFKISGLQVIKNPQKNHKNKPTETQCFFEQEFTRNLQYNWLSTFKHDINYFFHAKTNNPV